MKFITVALTTIAGLMLASSVIYSKTKITEDINESYPTKPASIEINEHERLHLIFMREEEKLARDVYITLGIAYPEKTVFGKISSAETYHTTSVSDVLERFNIDDPVKNDNVGVFSGEEFGWYFTEKFEKLTQQGLVSELDAMYVGAFIEELDMKDIKSCPEVMIDTIDSIQNADDCGLVYSNDRVINSLYSNLITGSESHLRAFVKNIEKSIGEGSYQAQVLTQDKVNEILDR